VSRGKRPFGLVGSPRQSWRASSGHRRCPGWHGHLRCPGWHGHLRCPGWRGALLARMRRFLGDRLLGCAFRRAV